MGSRGVVLCGVVLVCESRKTVIKGAVKWKLLGVCESISRFHPVN